MAACYLRIIVIVFSLQDKGLLLEHEYFFLTFCCRMDTKRNSFWLLSGEKPLGVVSPLEIECCWLIALEKDGTLAFVTETSRS